MSFSGSMPDSVFILRSFCTNASRASPPPSNVQLFHQACAYCCQVLRWSFEEFLTVLAEATQVPLGRLRLHAEALMIPPRGSLAYVVLEREALEGLVAFSNQIVIDLSND
jgi:hypothetical protein